MGGTPYKTLGFVVGFFAFLLPKFAAAQREEGLVARYTFNNGSLFNEVGGQPAKAYGTTYRDDRFGNPRSACYLNGSVHSYINLGTGDELKPPQGTISIWVKMITEVYSGEGYLANPFVLTKNGPGDDFFEAYAIGYNLNNKCISAVSALSYRNQVSAVANDPFELNTWHHVVMTYDDSLLCLYVDGVKECSVVKNFRTHFMAGDSVIVGGSANEKNSRFFGGYVDDITIYNRVLSEQAIADLYHEGDPNRYRNLMIVLLSTGAFIGLLIFLLIRKFRRAIDREKEKNRIQRQVYEMETRVIKAQMNPHFIFNSMNSIQQFILANDNVNANTYLVKFAKLLRKILESNTDEHISLDNEVDILHKYIEIESLRFEKTFSYEITVDNKLSGSGTRIPHMLIQPFVENAIWHGLLMKESEKNLRISFEYVNENSLSCVVDDNGAGRNARKTTGAVAKQKSLGVHFTSQRLELMRKEWGGDYGVEITDKISAEGTSDGTRVKITLPILKN